MIAIQRALNVRRVCFKLPTRSFKSTRIQATSAHHSHRPVLKRKLFWFFPLAGGLALYLSIPTKSFSSSIFTSPTLIPCPELSLSSPSHPTILSPAEPDQSIAFRIISLLHDNVWETVLTTTRFVYLFILFIPVIISSPMLLVGVPEKKYGWDRWGAVWWYNLLVNRMEAAGPTFVKVRMFYCTYILYPKIVFI